MLITPRCTLRTPTGADMPAMIILKTHPEVRRYLGGPLTLERARAEAARFIKGDHTTAWAVHLRQNITIGCVGLVQITPHHDGSDVELSYEFLPAIWGIGIASEAVQAVVSYAFHSLGLAGVIAETQVSNRASRRLHERIGSRHDRDLERFGEMQAIYLLDRRG